MSSLVHIWALSVVVVMTLYFGRHFPGGCSSHTRIIQRVSTECASFIIRAWTGRRSLVRYGPVRYDCILMILTITNSDSKQ